MSLKAQTAERQALNEQPPTFPALLSRLAIAGAISGVLSGAWAVMVTERALEPALAIEAARPTDSQEHPVEVVSRTTQLLGGFLGTLIAAVVFSVVVAAVYAVTRHRLPGRTDVGRMTTLAAVGFAVFALLPAVKIPANPPAVGDPGTVSTRTAIYAAVLICGAATALIVSFLVSTLRRHGADPATVAVLAAVATVALLALTVLLVPGSPDVIPPDVPAAVVWDFRLASLGQLAVLWASLGLAGGWLVDRISAPRAGGTT